MGLQFLIWGFLSGVVKDSTLLDVQIDVSVSSTPETLASLSLYYMYPKTWIFSSNMATCVLETKPFH
jgi:hypothetical protein